MKKILITPIFLLFIFSRSVGEVELMSPKYLIDNWTFSADTPYMDNFRLKLEGDVTYAENHHAKIEITYTFYSTQKDNNSITIDLVAEGTWCIQKDKIVEKYNNKISVVFDHLNRPKISKRLAKEVKKSIKQETCNFVSEIHSDSFTLSCDSFTYRMNRKPKE